MSKVASITNIIIGINKDKIVIPNELRDFLKKDDQGIDGFIFMLKNPKLSKRIPTDVRAQYEVLRASIIENLETSIRETKKVLDKIQKEPDEAINKIIQQALKE